LIRPVIEIKPVKGDALFADGNNYEIGAHQPIESIAVHAQVGGRVTKTNKARQEPQYPLIRLAGIGSDHATRIGIGNAESNAEACVTVTFRNIT